MTRDDIYQPSLVTSEPAEHQFGIGRNRVREFTCADYALHVERQNRKLDMLFKGDLLPSRSGSSRGGYNSGFANWINQARNMSDCTEGGPCKLNTGKDAPPLSTQLWHHVQQLIHKAVDLMIPLLKVVGVADEKVSPFCKKFSTKDQLMNEYIKYCPRTFSYHGKCGAQEPDDNDENKEHDNSQDKTEEVVMRLKTALGDIEEHLHSKNPSSTVEVDTAVTEEIISQTADNRQNQTKVSTKKKAHDRNEALKSAIYSLASCRNQNDLLQLSLRASAVIDDTEEGSILNNRKTKSSRQRQYEKSTGHATDELKSDNSEEEGGLYIERDALIESKLKWGDKKKSKSVKRTYRVQGVLQKYHGKWFTNARGEKEMEQIND